MRTHPPTRSIRGFFVGALGLLFLGAAATSGSAGASEPLRAVTAPTGLDVRKVALGKRLFHERRLSRDGTVSCASCHDLAKGGTDRRARSLGIGGVTGTINAPTVFNAALNFRQFWDGRAATLEEQVDGPMLAAAEMGSSWQTVLTVLRGDTNYAAEFARLYPEGVQKETVRDALVEFERSLVTPDSRFDRFLRGEAAALTPAEQAGYRKFKSYGCTSCHQGVGVGGNMFQNFGVAADYFADRGNVTPADLGRFNVTGRDEDRFVFKVPSLRNVALTPPYFHDGSAETLEQAIAVMGRYQLGRTLSHEDLDQIAQFLRTLTGVYAGAPL